MLAVMPWPWTMRTQLLSVATLAAAAHGCGDGAAPDPRVPGQAREEAIGAAPGADGDGTPAAPGDTHPHAPPPPRLAASPRVDLAANRARWHLYDGGLVIPVAAEGLRKYDVEYRSAWGDVRDADGVRGRALRGKRAALTIPWDPGDDGGDGAATVTVRARGKGKLSVAGGKRRAAAQALDGTWQTLTFELPAGALAEHEATLAIEAGKGTLVHSVTVAPPGAAPGCAGAPPPLSPADDAGALGGVARMSLLLEVPATSFLVATPAAPDGATARITVTPADGGEPVTLHDGALAPGAMHLALDAFAGQLVRLDVDDPSCAVRWRDAAIALADRAAPAPAAAPRDVILLVVDTLRSDRLTVYGDTRVQTPRLTAAAAQRGVVFRRNQSMAPSSPPSHATIHTGQIPRVHGAIGDTGDVGLDAPVLSAILGDAGFRTAFVGNNDFAMGRLRRVARWGESITPYYRDHDKDCGPIVEEALRIVGEARAAGERLFLSLLPIEPHVPYRYHAGITDAYYAGPFGGRLGKKISSAQLGKLRGARADDPRWDHLRGLYDGEVAYFDTCWARLEDGLAALGALDDTAIVMTSDHGEGMGERGQVGHAYALHQELVGVPFVVIGGGLPAGVVDVVTSNADIAPTILELLGLPVDPRMQGQSMVPAARAAAPWPARVVASEYGRSYALRGGRWHLVVAYDGDATLHDLVADPRSERDASAEAPMARRYLRDAAGLYLAHRQAWRAGTWGALNDIASTSPLARD